MAWTLIFDESQYIVWTAHSSKENDALWEDVDDEVDFSKRVICSKSSAIRVFKTYDSNSLILMNSPRQETGERDSDILILFDCRDGKREHKVLNTSKVFL